MLESKLPKVEGFMKVFLMKLPFALRDDTAAPFHIQGEKVALINAERAMIRLDCLMKTVKDNEMTFGGVGVEKSVGNPLETSRARLTVIPAGLRIPSRIRF